MRDGRTLLEFSMLCCFEIVVVIAILMVVGVLPWPFLPAEPKESPPAVASQRNAPAPTPAPAPEPVESAPEPVGITLDPQPAPEPAPELTPPVQSRPRSGTP
jgi:hypothetical protein